LLDTLYRSTRLITIFSNLQLGFVLSNGLSEASLSRMQRQLCYASYLGTVLAKHVPWSKSRCRSLKKTIICLLTDQDNLVRWRLFTKGGDSVEYFSYFVASSVDDLFFLGEKASLLVFLVFMLPGRVPESETGRWVGVVSSQLTQSMGKEMVDKPRNARHRPTTPSRIDQIRCQISDIGLGRICCVRAKKGKMRQCSLTTCLSLVELCH
jgi:hypothetical protein